MRNRLARTIDQLRRQHAGTTYSREIGGTMRPKQLLTMAAVAVAVVVGFDMFKAKRANG